MRYRRCRTVAVVALLASAATAATASGPGRSAHAATRPAATRLPGSGAGPAAAAALRIGGRTYLIRLDAKPHLGWRPDHSRFDRVRVSASLHTLTVTGVNLAGKPDTGDLVFVDNIDDSGAPGTGVESFQNGTATFDLVSGTYWAAGMFAQLSRNGAIIAARLDVLPQFTVSANTTVHISATAASSKVTMITPRPAISRTSTLTVVRSGPHRSASGPSGLTFDALNVPLWVSPVSRPPGHGRLQAYTLGQLTSPAGTKTPYGYTLNFVNPPGIIPPQRFTAHPNDLATVMDRYFQDVRSTAGWITEGGTPGELSAGVFFGGGVLPLPLPGRQIEYLSAKPAMLWQSEYVQYRTTFPGQPAGGQTSTFRLFRPGQRLNQVWNAYPLHPSSNVVLPGDRVALTRSSATRSGNVLNLDLTPFSDNQAGHSGGGLAVLPPSPHSDVSGTFAVYQNGKKIAAGNAVTSTGAFGDLQVSATLSPKPSVITFVVTASRASRHYRLSATSRDVYTWRTRSRPGATIPAPWLCDFVPRALSADRHCAVQPMMTLDYSVAGLAANGVTKPGRQAVTVSVGHIQLAPAARIASTRLQVSFDGGKTWHAAHMTRLSGNRFLAVFAAPPGAGVTLRTSATDAAGGSITETIIRGYQTGT